MKEKTYYELAREHQAEYKNDILLAVADGQLKELRAFCRYENLCKRNYYGSYEGCLPGA
ncbi:MAG: hypothetical protein ACOCMZ_02720 [Acetivibrio ethanolgignens]